MLDALTYYTLELVLHPKMPFGKVLFPSPADPQSSQVLPGTEEPAEGKLLGTQGQRDLCLCILQVTSIFMEGAWWGWKFPPSLFPSSGIASREHRKRGNVITAKFGNHTAVSL